MTPTDLKTPDTPSEASLSWINPPIDPWSSLLIPSNLHWSPINLLWSGTCPSPVNQMTVHDSPMASGSFPGTNMLILSVCALLLCCVTHLQWLLQLFPFQVDQVICGFYVTLFSLVCFVCIVEIFMPRVSSLQSLTLGTRSVFCSSPHNSVSDTEHKSAFLWIILTISPLVLQRHITTCSFCSPLIGVVCGLFVWPKSLTLTHNSSIVFSQYCCQFHIPLTLIEIKMRKHRLNRSRQPCLNLFYLSIYGGFCICKLIFQLLDHLSLLYNDGISICQLLALCNN